MSTTKAKGDATPAEKTGPAGDTSKPESTESPLSGTTVPDFVIDALELAELTGWYPVSPGDMAAGALMTTGYRDIDRLNGTGVRTVPVAMIYGITVGPDGEPTQDRYIELVGAHAVLERLLNSLHGCEVGTLVRVTYRGHLPSSTKGHSDYADYTLAVGRRSDKVSLDIISNAPELPTGNTIPALDAGEEPF